MTTSDWTHYFEQLAEKHSSVLHSPTAKHFFRAEVEDFFQDIRSRAKFPAVMLESCALDLTVQASLFATERTLAFTVIDSCRVDDYPAITETQSRCETIAQSFLGRLLRDIQDDYLGGVRLVSAHFELIENVPLHYYGQRVELVVSEPVCPYSNPNDWIDETH